MTYFDLTSQLVSTFRGMHGLCQVAGSTAQLVLGNDVNPPFGDKAKGFDKCEASRKEHCDSLVEADDGELPMTLPSSPPSKENPDMRDKDFVEEVRKYATLGSHDV